MIIIPTILFFPWWATVQCQQYHETILINRLKDFQQQNREVNLINRLNDFFHFDHNIFLLESSIDHSLYVPTKSNEIPQTLCSFGNNNNDTHLATLQTLTSKNPLLIVVGTQVTLSGNVQLWVQVESIKRLKYNVKIGIFFVNQNVSSMNWNWNWNCKYFLCI